MVVRERRHGRALRRGVRGVDFESRVAQFVRTPSFGEGEDVDDDDDGVGAIESASYDLLVRGMRSTQRVAYAAAACSLEWIFRKKAPNSQVFN